MGYRRNRKIYVLKWPEDSEYHGLEVRVRAGSIGQIVSVSRFAELRGTSDINVISGAVDSLLEIFVALIDGWNYEDEQGEPIAPGDIGNEDMDFVLMILGAWMDAVTTVSVPLGGNSPNGENENFPEDSLPMVVNS